MALAFSVGGGAAFGDGLGQLLQDLLIPVVAGVDRQGRLGMLHHINIIQIPEVVLHPLGG